ncbi:MAG TPA: hypothetical protein VGF59_31640 [Bryobacteraceae bacterium]
MVYKIDRLGAQIIIAGTKGAAGYSGDGGPATASKFSKPNSAVVAAGGTIYIADLGNNRIRKIATDGTITTYARGRERRRISSPATATEGPTPELPR